MSPRLTVAIPFFDEERYLGDAVRSVLRQSFTDFELLLVDDGSRDGSLAIARAFRDPRVRVVADGVRRHLPARLNEIVRLARGALVARMDADDVIHPERFARQLARFDADPRLDAVGTWAGLVDETDEPFAVSESASLPATPRTALERGVLAHASLVARRDWLCAHPYDETLTRAEDRDLWCRTPDARLASVAQPLYVVRVTSRDRRFLPDYLEGQRQNRLLFLRHGPRIVGLRRTAELVLAAHGKSALMRVAARVGAGPRLVRRRGRPPTAEEREMIVAALWSARQRP